MQSRKTYTLVASVLLTVAACARQEEPGYDYNDEPADEGGTKATGGTTAKAGTTSTSTSGSTSTNHGGSTTLPPAGTAGKGGTKATGGTGGTSGTGPGGAVGEGGSAEEPTENMPVDGVTVTFKPQEGSSADFLGGELFVHNDSAESFTLASIKIRYYFTNELNSPPAFLWQWGQFGPASNLGGITCSGTVVEMPSPTADANFYVELTCPDGDFASGGLLKTSWKAGNQGAGKLTQDGDWSYIAAEGEAEKVVVLDGNTIIWGVEP